MDGTYTEVELKSGRLTPWGRADFVKEIRATRAEYAHIYVVRCDTPSHGGYFVPKALLSYIPEAHRAYARSWSGSEQWYEEDCAWACVALAFPELFPTKVFVDDDQDLQTYARNIVARYVDKTVPEQSE